MKKLKHLILLPLLRGVIIAESIFEWLEKIDDAVLKYLTDLRYELEKELGI